MASVSEFYIDSPKGKTARITRLVREIGRAIPQGNGTNYRGGLAGRDSREYLLRPVRVSRPNGHVDCPSDRF